MDPNKGGNPFLMDDYATTSDAASPSNPFLQDFDSNVPQSTGDNPFLNFNAEEYQAPTTMDSTNPFASFGAEAEVAPNQQPSEADLFLEEPTNLFEAPIEPSQIDLFPTEENPILEVVQSEKPKTLPARPPPPPPPPRPQPPAAQNKTQDLILSVTGAMDATSNHLLDRLQATRTPSPTLMHSPSPTPEQSFADLLDVDGNVPDLIADDSFKSENMLDIFDAPITESLTPLTTVDNLVSGIQDNLFTGMAEEETVAQAEDTLTSDFPEAACVKISETRLSSSSVSSIDKPVEDEPAVVPPEPVANIFTTMETSSVQESNYQPDFESKESRASPTPASEFPQVYEQKENMNDFGANVVDAFDAFASKFDKAGESERFHTNAGMGGTGGGGGGGGGGGDPFLDAFGSGQTAMDTSSDVWGDSSAGGSDVAFTGFDESDGFDSFLSMTAPPDAGKMKRSDSADSDEAPDFSVVIKPREGEQNYGMEGGPVPVLAPPPKSPLNTAAYGDSSPRFNPFDKSGGFAGEAILPTDTAQPEFTRTDSQETPPTPLFDEDMSVPLEDFPRIEYTGDGWEMQLRQSNKKKIAGQKFWKKIFIRLVYQGDSPVLQLLNKKEDKDPFQELPLLPCYSVSDISAQQLDQYGKIFTVKLQYIFYKERPGVRPGQVTKAERLTNKISQFAAYAIQGDYQGCKEFGSDLKKLGLPVEHAPQISQLFKLGSQNYEDLKQFSCTVEEALFKLSAHRERALNYKMEEVQITVVDELYVEQNAYGHIEKQIARVRLFFLGFLSGMPDIELGINDMRRQGKEVVGRHDIIPVVTEEWIRLESIEFHSCIQQDEFERTKTIKFKPPDACYIELMRFRVRPPKNRELPLQLKAVMCVTGNKVELRADVLIPGVTSRKLGQVPCEDVMIRFPIPECWIYLFRVEKHFRYGSVKSAHRRTGKVKGFERFLGAMGSMEPQLMEVTSGQAKYEHQHHSIVWRMPRLPKEGQGAYTTHGLVCRMNLMSYDQIPEKLTEYAYVEFTMPATQVSHTTARSVSLQNSDSDAPPEKYVRNLSRHEYRVGIEHTQGEGPGAYVVATKKIPETTAEVPAEIEHTASAAHDSDSDSDAG